MNTDLYSYRIIWSEEDGEHVGLCAEFPSLSYLASTPNKALSGITALVKGIVKDMLKENEPIPEPIGKKQFSGRFVVRVPPEIHRELARKAAEEGVSLNRLVSSKLAVA